MDIKSIKLAKPMGNIMSRPTVISAAAFILVAILIVLSEVFGVPDSLANLVSGSEKWTNGATDAFFVLIVGAFATWLISKLVAERTIVKEELSLRAQLLDAMTDSIFVYYPDGKIIYANESAHKSHGFSQEELKAMNRRDLVAPESASNFDGRVQEVLDKGYATFESTHLRKDDSIMPVEMHARLVEVGSKAAILSVCRDISERKRAEHALRESENNFQNSLDNSPLGIRIITENGDILYTNRTLLDIFGYSSIEELKAVPKKNVYTPESYAAHVDRKNKRKTGELIPSNYETSIIRKDGEIRHLEVTRGEVLWNGEKQFQAVYQDITEHKKNEEAVKNLAKFPAENPNPVLRVDKNGTILYGNNASSDLLKVWGCKVGQTLPANWFTFAKGVMASGKPEQTEEKAGERIFLMTFTPITDSGYTNLYAVDITERKRAEEAVRESEQKFSKAFQMSPNSIAITNSKSGRLIDVNETWVGAHGYSRPEAIGKTTTELGLWSNPADRDVCIAELRDKGRVRNFEANFKTKSGEKTFLMSGEPIDIKGEQCVLWEFHDITERKRMEVALQHSLQFNSSVLENSPFPIYVINSDGTIGYINPALEILTGYSSAELVGKKAPFPYWPKDKPEYLEMFETALQKGSYRRERQFCKKNGESFWVEITSTNIMQDGELRYHLSSWVDITERRKAQESIEHLNRVLRAIREVNQLLVREKDTQRLIQQTCELLIEHRSYSNVMVVLIDESGIPYTYAESGMSPAFKLVAETLQKGILPPCCERARLHEGIYHITNRADVCPGCPIGTDYAAKHAMCVKLEHGERVYGYLMVAIELALGNDVDEQLLFTEVAGDLAFGLHSIEQEQKRNEMEHVLHLSEARYHDLYDNAPVAYYSVGVDGFFRESNRSTQLWLGYSADELRGMKVFDIYAEESTSKAQSLFAKFQQGLTMQDEEMVYRRKNGEKIYGLLTATHIKDENGQVISSRSVVRDITERKKAEKALVDSETRYRRLFEAAKDGILIVNAETGLIIDANPFLTALLGYPKEDFIGKELWELGFLGDIVANKDNFEELSQKGHIRYEDLPLRTANGREAAVEFVSNVYDVDGIKVIQCNIRDITERKRVQEALKVSEEKFHSLFNEAGDGILLIDAQTGYIVDCNPEYQKQTGRSLEQLRKLKVWELTVPAKQEASRQRFFILLNNVPVEALDNEMQRLNGDIIPVEFRIKLITIGSRNFVLSMVRDITERKKAEEALRVSEEKLRIMLETLPEGITVTDMDGKIVKTNKATAYIYGYDNKEEIIGLNILEFIAKKDHTRTTEIIKKSINEGPLGVIELTQLRKDRSEFPAEVNGNVLKDPSGNPIGLITITEDITERKKAEKALVDSEMRYRRLFEAAKDGILILNAETGQITDVNPFLTNLLGRPKQDLLGKELWEIGAFKDIASSKEAFKQLQEKEYVRYEDLPRELPCAKSTGRLNSFITQTI